VDNGARAVVSTRRLLKITIAPKSWMAPFLTHAARVGLFLNRQPGPLQSSSYERHLERRSMSTSEESCPQGCDAATPRWAFTQTAKTGTQEGRRTGGAHPPREHRPLQKHVPGRIPSFIAELRSARPGLAEVVINCERTPIINEHICSRLGSAELTSYAEPPWIRLWSA
jgi:hypothetical protein